MLGDILNMKGYNPNDYLFPLATRGLGGLFLFDGALTEDVTNVHFPSDVHLVGHAGQYQNTDNPLRGSVNTLESMRTETGYQTVWDFNTSQANGTIASLALTNSQAGEYPFEAPTRQDFRSTSFDSIPVAYDEANRELYYLNQTTIYKTRMPNEKLTVADPYYGFTTLGADEYVCDISLSKSSYGNWEINYGYDGYLYVTYLPTNSSGNATLYQRRYKISDFSFEAEDEQQITLKNVQAFGAGGYKYHNCMVVTNGYYYIRGKDSYTFYTVEIANTENITKVDLGNKTYYEIMRPNRGGGMTFVAYEPLESGGTKKVSLFVYPDGTVVNEGAARDFGGPQYLETDTLTGFVHPTNYSRMFLSLTPWYLGSICNLETPVLKTPQTDMKVTYTLTDVG